MRQPHSERDPQSRAFPEEAEPARSPPPAVPRTPQRYTGCKRRCPGPTRGESAQGARPRTNTARGCPRLPPLIFIRTQYQFRHSTAGSRRLSRCSDYPLRLSNRGGKEPSFFCCWFGSFLSLFFVYLIVSLHCNVFFFFLYEEAIPFLCTRPCRISQNSLIKG